jgi:hypothetical protein
MRPVEMPPLPPAAWPLPVVWLGLEGVFGSAGRLFPAGAGVDAGGGGGSVGVPGEVGAGMAPSSDAGRALSILRSSDISSDLS